ncbi:hypothetical protein ACFY8P_21090 [Streptomyces sp. NPDC012693]|uniref:hypothetical protein n=1 Tax=Streptomyces sp. NPDC012693 TaxID=3364844 RepID=UPI00368C73A9
MAEPPAADPPTRVFLVDAHEVVHRGLRDLINDDLDMDLRRIKGSDLVPAVPDVASGQSIRQVHQHDAEQG